MTSACIPRCARLSLLLTLLCSSAKGDYISDDGYTYYTTKKSKCLNPPRTARRVELFIGECQEEVKNKLVNEAYQILREEVSKNHPQLVDNDDYAFNFIETTQEKPTHPGSWPNEPQLPSKASPYYDEKMGNYHEAHYGDYGGTASTTPEYGKRKKRAARLLHRLRRRISDTGHGAGIYHPTLVPHEDKRIAGCLLHCVYGKNNAIDQNGWPTLDGLVDFYSEGVNEHGFFMATLRSVNLCLRAVTNKYHIDRRKLPKQGESCDLAFDVFDCISDQLTGYCLDQYY